MKEMVIIIVCVGIVIFLVVRAHRMKNTSESKVSAYEHPATYKKPEIEMVSTSLEKKDDSGSSFDMGVKDTNIG